MTPPFQPVAAATSGATTGSPELCLWVSGGLYLNAAAVREYFDDAERVGIHHDPEREGLVVGLEPDAEPADAPHVRSLVKDDSGADINAVSVVRALGIEPDGLEEAHHFDLEDSDEDSVVATADLSALVGGGQEESLPSGPGEVEQAAAEAVADIDEATDEPEGGNVEEIFEAGVPEDPEFADLDTPDWLDEGSFYASLDEASDLEELRDVLGWRDHDGDLETVVDRLDVWPELHGGNHA